MTANVLGGALVTGFLEATTQGAGDQSRSQAIVETLVLNVGGNTITGDLAPASSQCTCTAGGAICEGGVMIGNLRINGDLISVAGVNQTIPLPGGGFVIINEQTVTGTGQMRAITVNGVRVFIPDDPLIPGDQGANVILASASSDITCGTINGEL